MCPGPGTRTTRFLNEVSLSGCPEPTQGSAVQQTSFQNSSHSQVNAHLEDVKIGCGPTLRRHWNKSQVLRVAAIWQTVTGS